MNEKIAEKERVITELQTTESKALDNNTELEKELVEIKMASRKKDATNEELIVQLKEALNKVIIVDLIFDKITDLSINQSIN